MDGVLFTSHLGNGLNTADWRKPVRLLKMNLEIFKPRKTVVPLAAGRVWRVEPGVRFEEKMDGRFALATFSPRGAGAVESIVAGEQMLDGVFFAFDVVQYDGQDVRAWPLRERLPVLDAICQHAGYRRPESMAHGGELLQRVLARGGEGVVCKSLDAPYGEMLACKRVETFQCVVTRTGNTQSVEIADACTLAPRGHVALRGGKCDRVRVGSIIKVEGMGITAAGCIRESRPCKDTPTSWLIQF